MLRLEDSLYAWQKEYQQARAIEDDTPTLHLHPKCRTFTDADVMSYADTICRWRIGLLAQPTRFVGCHRLAYTSGIAMCSKSCGAMDHRCTLQVHGPQLQTDSLLILHVPFVTVLMPDCSLNRRFGKVA